MTQQTRAEITVTPIGESFAAEIHCRAFTTPPSEEEARLIEQAMDRYAVVVLRGQEIDDEGQIEFSRTFGPLELPPNFGLRDDNNRGRIRPELFDVSNLNKQGEIDDSKSYKARFGKGNQIFHTDSSYNDLPTKWSLLSARSIPDVETFTEFMDMRAVYERLPMDLKDRVDGLSADHSLWYSRVRTGQEDMVDKLRNAGDFVSQPLVQTAPDGRKTLFVSSHAAQVTGWPEDVGRKLVDTLYEFACAQPFIYRHRWQPHDLLVWDNRCTMHRAVAYDDTGLKRDVRRATISESGPERSGSAPR